MEGVILAAGRGTRLRPITDHTPKALVPVGGVPMIDRIGQAMRAAGVTQFYVNAHHLAEQVVAHVMQSPVFQRGANAVVVVEDELLDTGGALLNIASIFGLRGPVLVHNADILTSIDLAALVATHKRKRPLATMVTRLPDRPGTLLFDDRGLVGRDDRARGRLLARTSEGSVVTRGYACIQVVEPRAFAGRSPEIASVLDVLLDGVRQGETVRQWPADDAAWTDIGDHESLAAAERALRVAAGRGATA